MIDYKNQTIWIIGGSSGIGRALAIQFSEIGAKLILSARNLKKLEETKNLCSNPKEIKLLQMDLEQYTTLKSKTNEALTLFGDIDVLINNGGVSQRGTAFETSLEVDKKIIDINYFGNIALTKALLPHFINKKSGQIAVTSSVVGKFGTPLRSSYSASKHALHGFYDSLRAEIHNDNIKITMVCSGPINTAISENALTGAGGSQKKKDKSITEGISPEILAKKYISALQNNKQELWIGKKEVFGIYIKMLFPKLFARIIRKIRVI